MGLGVVLDTGLRRDRSACRLAAMSPEFPRGMWLCHWLPTFPWLSPLPSKPSPVIIKSPEMSHTRRTCLIGCDP